MIPLIPLEPINKVNTLIDQLNFNVTPKYFSSMIIPMSLQDLYYFKIKSMVEE